MPRCRARLGGPGPEPLPLMRLSSDALPFQRREDLDGSAAVDLEPRLLLEIRDRRLALGPNVAVWLAADVVTSLREQRLQFFSPFARQQRIVGWPGGDDASPAAQAVGEHAGGEGVGFGGIVGKDGVEIARHQKSRPVASG